MTAIGLTAAASERVAARLGQHMDSLGSSEIDKYQMVRKESVVRSYVLTYLRLAFRLKLSTLSFLVWPKWGP